MHPAFTLTLNQLKALVSDQSPEIQTAILANPVQFLTDYKPLLSQDSLLVLVDKRHELASDYEPKDLASVKNYPVSRSRDDIKLSKTAINAFLELDKVSKKQGIRVMISSGYRSWLYQRDLFQRYIKEDGLATADRYSARAGHSQHQLGTAFDIGSITPQVAETKEGQWMFAHAEEFGFSLSYPQGLEELTGYMYEPWHYRYIGKEACRVQKTWFGDIQQNLLVFHAAHAEELRSSMKK